MRGRGVVGARTDVAHGSDARTSAADESGPSDLRLPLFHRIPRSARLIPAGDCIFSSVHSLPAEPEPALAYESRLTRCGRCPVENLHTTNAPSCVNRLGQGSDDEHDFQNAGVELSNLSGFRGTRTPTRELLVHVLPATEPGRARKVGRVPGVAKSQGQSGARQRRPVSCHPRVRRQHRGRVVPVWPRGRTPTDRRRTRLPEGGEAERSAETLANHVLLRRPQAPRARRGQARAQGRARIDPGPWRRHRRGVPGRVEANVRGPGVALVRDAEHVPAGRLQADRSARDERHLHAKEDSIDGTRIVAGLPSNPRPDNRSRSEVSSPARLHILPSLQEARGPVDQLEDRYLGMVEAVGSNPTRSTFPWSGGKTVPEDSLKQAPYLGCNSDI